MTEPQRQQRNADRLLELFPTFRARLAKVISELEVMDYFFHAKKNVMNFFIHELKKLLKPHLH